MGGLYIRKRISKHRLTGPAGSRYLSTICLSFAWSNGLSALLFATCAIIGRLTRIHILSVLASRQFDWRLVIAASLSLAATAALMIMAPSEPPACRHWDAYRFSRYHHRAFTPNGHGTGSRVLTLQAY